jgi:4-amino-4-deoxy-L-arabinose transferase-like glycosyltransferase
MNLNLDLDNRSRRTDWLAWMALGLLWLFHAVSNFVWLKIDTRPPFWDTANHAITAIHLSRSFAAIDLSTAMRQWVTSSVYPPLMHWLCTPLILLFWPTADVLLGIQTFFLGVLLIATYGIAAHYGGRKTGLLAAFIVSMYPLIYGLERHFLTDIPLVAMVALSIWLLVRSEGFERRGASILCGLALGLGLLTKWSFVVFAGGPFFVAALAAVISRSRRRLLNMGLALLAAFLAAAPWYLANLGSTLDFFRGQSVYAGVEGDPAVGSLNAWLYYARYFVGAQVLLPLAIVFVVSLVLWLIKRRLRYETMFLLLGWIVLPYVASSLFVNKDPRYTMSYLPAVAIITALGLASIKPKAIRFGLVTLLILYASLQFLGLTWGLSSRLPPGLLPNQISLRLGSSSFPVYAEKVHIASPPEVQDWPIQAILHDVLRSSQDLGTRQRKLVVLPDSPCFEQNVFKYFVILDQMPIEVVVVTGVVEVADAREQILASDFLVTKTGYLGPAWSIQQSRLYATELHDPSSELGRRFQRIGEYPLPDGSLAELYRRIR